MHAEEVVELPADGGDRVQGVERALEDDRDLGPANGPQLLFARGEQVDRLGGPTAVGPGVVLTLAANQSCFLLRSARHLLLERKALISRDHLSAGVGADGAPLR